MPLSMTWPQYLRHACAVDGAEARLSPLETEVLLALLLRRGKVVHRDEMIEAVWPDPDFEPDASRTEIAVLVCRIRKKLGADAIATVFSRGYMLEIDR